LRCIAASRWCQGIEVLSKVVDRGVGVRSSRGPPRAASELPGSRGLSSRTAPQGSNLSNLTHHASSRFVPISANVTAFFRIPRLTDAPDVSEHPGHEAKQCPRPDVRRDAGSAPVARSNSNGGVPRVFLAAPTCPDPSPRILAHLDNRQRARTFVRAPRTARGRRRP
jgi:hypothetical protein